MLRSGGRSLKRRQRVIHAAVVYNGIGDRPFQQALAVFTAIFQWQSADDRGALKQSFEHDGFSRKVDGVVVEEKQKEHQKPAYRLDRSRLNETFWKGVYLIWLGGAG
jgi:hypothetical protein